jgi:cytochrome P450
LKDVVLIKEQETTMENFNEASLPGKWLVDLLPFLKHLPTWLPGMHFKRVGQSWNAQAMQTREAPYHFAVGQMKRKDAKMSLITEAFKKYDNSPPPEIEHDLQFTTSTLFGGGFETTAFTLEVFFLEMALHPEAQRRAQREIDDVVGQSRLPNLTDKERLPYLNALILEVQRRLPIGNIGIPHVAAEDDEINGYFIPRGAMVMVNPSTLFSDPAVYKDPLKFKPERYLGDNPEPDIRELMWGHGRRICPGRFLAIQNLFLIISNTLSCFEISSIKGQEPTVKFTAGTICHPEPFKVNIKARSTAHEALIRELESMEGGMIEKGDSHLL